MRKAMVAVGFLAALALALGGCGGASTSGSSGTTGTTVASQGSSGSASQGGASTAALESSCVKYYNDGDWGFTSGDDGSTDSAPFCNCVIPAWLSEGDSAQKIATAMQSSATDDSGSAPIGFFQQTNCTNEDPTIDPNTGAPYTG